MTEVERDLRVIIAIPCQDSVKAGFAYDLARLTGVCGQAGLTVGIVQNRGTIIPQQRATLVAQAIELKATHIFWLDSDMRFPKESLFRLLAHDKPIVGCNYARRREPVLPTAEHREHGYLFTTPEAEGLAEVTQCGFGVMLTSMDVFAAIPEPWFSIGFNTRDLQYVGEDFFFCTQARKAGFEILIDQGLSREIRHTGDHDFTHAETLAAREILLAPTIERQLEIVRG